MNVWIGWALVVLAFGAGWLSYGWPGIALAVTVVTFWLLLQLTRTLKVMRVAGQAPLGHIESAVMLNAKLRAGMPLLDVLRVTKSLGRKAPAQAPSNEADERFIWSDAGGVSVHVHVKDGRVASWRLERPSEKG